MKSSFRKAGLVLVMSLAMVACDIGINGVPTTDTIGGTYGGGGTAPGANTDTDLTVSVTTDRGSVNLHESSSFTKTCKISTTDTTKDIICYAEGEELDVYDGNLTIKFNVPASMCQYMIETIPYYFNKMPGYGPVSITVDNSSGTPGVPVIVPASQGGFNGAPTCNYDYTQSNGPNCCLGTYTYTTIDPPAVAGGANVVTVSPGEWGGEASACLKGPAMDLFPVAKSGYPKSLLYYLAGSATTGSYIVPSPRSKEFSSNLYAANYFNPADHGGTFPLAYLDVDQTGINAAYSIISGGFPYHEFACLDRDQELLARIRVEVREWNTHAEYIKGATGDPDTSGNETTPDATLPNNDYVDWKDLGAAYPNEGG